jgi:hypothetical protein
MIDGPKVISNYGTHLSMNINIYPLAIQWDKVGVWLGTFQRSYTTFIISTVRDQLPGNNKSVLSSKIKVQVAKDKSNPRIAIQRRVWVYIPTAI